MTPTTLTPQEARAKARLERIAHLEHACYYDDDPASVMRYAIVQGNLDEGVVMTLTNDRSEVIEAIADYGWDDVPAVGIDLDTGKLVGAVTRIAG